jgi:hypothetical protein
MLEQREEHQPSIRSNTCFDVADRRAQDMAMRRAAVSAQHASHDLRLAFCTFRRAEEMSSGTACVLLDSEYPPTQQHSSGESRLMYEANPIAFLAEQAGGMASDGAGRILEFQPAGLRQWTPLLVGSPAEIEMLLETLR